MSTEILPIPAELEVDTFHGIVTVAPQMHALFERLRRAARSEAAILIRGETGTGKELAAAALHQLSRRRGRAFKAINCASLTPELAASELFGHVRGAFTGAIRERRGLFALADGGTVFLDEVAELSLDIQARLLRVLQERTFVPVGGTDPVSVDVRLLAATNKSLRDEVEAGRFREDLMYRIRVVPLFLPPLVERSGDVEALTWFFIDAFNARSATRRARDSVDSRDPASPTAPTAPTAPAGPAAPAAPTAPAGDAEVPAHRLVESLTADVHARLLAYPWPGNVRELRNVIEYAFAIGEGPTITADELPPELRGEAPRRSARLQDLSPQDEDRARIIEALRSAGGLKSRAAELLGISRTTLWRKMREHRLDN